MVMQEGQPNGKAPEALHELGKFASEQIGISVMLTGRSIDSIYVASKRDNRKDPIFNLFFPKFDKDISLNSEVALLNNIFLPNSLNKTFVEQEEMVKEFSKKIGKEMPGFKAIIGKVADYVDLRNVLNNMAKKLFEVGQFTRTVDETSDHNKVVVGNAMYGNFTVSRLNSNIGFDGVGVIPLIVPASLKV